MLEFMRAGGFGMWVILALGAVALGIAGSFAWRPTERKLGLIRPMSVSIVFATLLGVFAALGAVFKHVTTLDKFSKSPDLHLIVMTGLGESMAPAILGFAMLTVVWLISTMGLRRQV